MTNASASIPARVGARAIDYVALGGVGWALGRSTGFGPGWLGAQAGLVLLYFIVADAVAGTTLGKAVLGMRVVASGGDKPLSALVIENVTALEHFDPGSAGIRPECAFAHARGRSAMSSCACHGITWRRYGDETVCHRITWSRSRIDIE
jgi:hypothetical protein